MRKPLLKKGAKSDGRYTLKISPMVNVDYSFIRVPEFKVCSYETTVENGRFEASIPRRYGFAFKEGLARIDIKKPKLSVLTIKIRDY
ncbi:MAG: hypothetical protein ACLR5N_07595 [Haemophilus parainfluenzae]